MKHIDKDITQNMDYIKINIEQKISEVDSFTPRRYQQFFEHFPDGDLKILDVGCNTGRGGYILKNLNHNLSITGLDCVRERLAQLSSEIYSDSICSTTTKIPSKSNCFDIILAGEFIEHLIAEDILTTFNEFHRILKPNGLLMLTTPNPSGIILKIRGGSIIGGAHLSEHKFCVLKKVLADLNFTNIKAHGTGRVSKYLGKRFPLFLYNSYLAVAQKAKI